MRGNRYHVPLFPPLFPLFPGSGYFSTAQFDSMVDIVTGRRFVLRLVIELAALSIDQI